MSIAEHPYVALLLAFWFGGVIGWMAAAICAAASSADDDDQPTGIGA